jgi:hypothetical protein
MGVLEGVFCSVVAGAFGLYALVALRRLLRLRRLEHAGLSTMGTVAQLEAASARAEGRTVSAAVTARVSFVRATGQAAQLSVTDRECASWKVGDQVPIVYDPAAPAVAQVDIPGLAPTTGGIVRGLLGGGLVAAVAITIALTTYHAPTMTVRVTQAAVLHQEGAVVRYPASLLLGRKIAAGVTTLQAQYHNVPGPRGGTQHFDGYDGTPVPGTASLLLAAAARWTTIATWYQHRLLSHGWCRAHPSSMDLGEAGTVRVETYTHGDGWGSAQVETFVLYSGSPGAVTLLSGLAPRSPVRAGRTLFATRYSLYPSGTTSVSWTGASTC